MIRFRPIAPKPTAGSGSVSATPVVNSDHCHTQTNRRSKRCRKQRRTSDTTLSNAPLTTLSLLPEIPDPKKSPASATSSSGFDNHLLADGLDLWPPCPPAPAGSVRSPWSCVAVESVSDTCLDREAFTEEEMRRSLEDDTCPGLLTDACNYVRWANDAYRRMVGQESGEGLRVELVSKERLPEVTVAAAFTCRVRVQYTCQKGRSWLTVPCDVWRMRGGGCAWRLDVKAALRLGR